MPTVKYIESGGEVHELEVPVGTSLMQAAVESFIPGMGGECGGAMACATCHCFVDEAWLDKLKPMAPDEKLMLTCTAVNEEENSRLSCQIDMTEDMDGITLRLPAMQS